MAYEPNINLDPEMIQRALSATGLNQNNPSAIDFNQFIGDNPYYTQRAAPAPSMVLPPTTTPNPYVTAGQASGTPVIDPTGVSTSIYNNPAVARALEDLNIPVNASGIPTGANPITQTLGNLSAETGNRLALGLDVAPTEFEPTFFDQQIANVVAPTTVPTSVYNNPEVAAVLDTYQVPTNAAGVPTDVNPVTELLGNLGAETTNRLAMGLDVAPTEFTPSFAPPADMPPPEALGASAVERASAPAATVAPTPAPAPTPDYAAMQNDARETMDTLSRSSLGSFLGITPRAPAPAPMPVTPPPAVAPAPMPVTPPPAVAPAPMPTPVVDSEGIGSLRAPSERAEPALPPVVAVPAPALAPVPVMPPPEPVVAPPPAPMPAPVAAPAPVVAPPPPPPAPVVDNEGIGSLIAPPARAEPPIPAPVAVAPPPPPPMVAPTPVAPPPEPVVAPAPPPPPAPIPAPAEPVFTPTPMPAPTPVRAEPAPARAPSERMEPVFITPQNVTQPTGQTATEQLNQMANLDLVQNVQPFVAPPEPVTEGVGSLVATTPDIQEMVLPAAPPAAPAVVPQATVGAGGIPQLDLQQLQLLTSRLPFNLFSGIR